MSFGFDENHRKSVKDDAALIERSVLHCTYGLRYSVPYCSVRATLYCTGPYTYISNSPYRWTDLSRDVIMRPALYHGLLY